jgi:hypothetical protein
MADNDIIIGCVINITGAIGVLSGIILFFLGIVLLVFRRSAPILSFAAHVAHAIDNDCRAVRSFRD